MDKLNGRIEDGGQVCFYVATGRPGSTELDCHASEYLRPISMLETFRFSVAMKLQRLDMFAMFEDEVARRYVDPSVRGRSVSLQLRDGPSSSSVISITEGASAAPSSGTEARLVAPPSSTTSAGVEPQPAPGQHTVLGSGVAAAAAAASAGDVTSPAPVCGKRRRDADEAVVTRNVVRQSFSEVLQGFHITSYESARKPVWWPEGVSFCPAKNLRKMDLVAVSRCLLQQVESTQRSEAVLRLQRLIDMWAKEKNDS